MNKTIKFFGILSIFSTIIFLQACQGNTKKVKDDAETSKSMMSSLQMRDSINYACPMHKNIKGKKGDKCSECGMDMQEMTFCCSTHKNMIGMKGDKCSECGMDMQEMTYCCPMHKNMIGMKGDKCSECGMDMQEMKNINH
ncbi:MAG: heavy metal-binding domain-containing protein [Saprospiraceae bacterium]